MTIKQFARVVEIRTKVVSASALLIGTFLAVYRGYQVDPISFSSFVAAVLAVDMGTTALNTFFDFSHGIDRGAQTREREKVLVHEGVAPGAALLTAVALFGIAGIAGLVVAWRTTWLLVPIGVASMLVGYAYNGGPRPISTTPLGELFAGGFLGWVLVSLTVYVISLRFDGGAALAALPSGLIVASILTTNNTCDIVGDREGGRRTLSIVVGKRVSAVLIYAQGAAAWAVAVLAVVRGVFPTAVGWGLVPAGVVTILTYVHMHRRGYSHATKGESMGGISRVLLVYTIAVTAGLIAAILQGSQ